MNYFGTKKIFTLLLLGATLFQGTAAQAVLATTGATTSAQPKTTTQVDETSKTKGVLDSDFFSESELSSPVATLFKQRANSVSSATLRKPAKLVGLKETLKADETQVVAVENAQAENLDIQLFDLDGHQVNLQNQVVSTENPAVISIKPSNQFKPGRFHLNVTDSFSNQSLSQDFNWGVLALNLNKSIYNSSEEAFISMAVLDQDGEMVCNATLELQIIAPDESKTILSTSQGTVIANPQCLSKKMSLVPDYQAHYKVSQLGIYR